MATSKKEGARRFSGYGLKKWDPKPGTVEWYKANLLELLNNTAINIRNGTGVPMEDYTLDDGKTWRSGAETMAARVLSWSEKPLAGIVKSGAMDLPDKCPGCGTYTNHEAAEGRSSAKK